MAQEKFGQSSDPSWLDWSENTRAYIEIMDADLASALKQVENREASMLQGEIDAFLLNDSHGAQLPCCLKLRTEGSATAQAEKVHVLEQWRLTCEYDPIGLGIELIQL